MKTKINFLVIIFIVSSFQIKANNNIVEIFRLSGGEIFATYLPEQAKFLIDNDINTEYSYSGENNDIIYKSPVSYVPMKYSITSSKHDSKFDPQDWIFSASIDGINWDDLQTLNYQNFSKRKQTREFSIVKKDFPQSYQYFRLRITKIKSGAKDCKISEWNLFGEELATPKAPSEARLRVLPSNNVKLSWRDNSQNETSFEVERSFDGVFFHKVASVPENSTHYIDESLSAGILCVYRVVANMNGCKSTYSTSNIVTTNPAQLLTCITKGRNCTVKDKNNTGGIEGVQNLIDGFYDTKYLSSTADTWVVLELPDKFVSKQYCITSANDFESRDPKEWIIEGSNDKQSWTQLDRQKEQFFNTRFQKNVYALDNDASYKYYRLKILNNHGAPLTQLSEWLLYADIPPIEIEEELPKQPENFKLEIRTFNSAKLSWNDVPNETEYIIERSIDGLNWDYTYKISQNNTECYPYALQPNTTYYFKLKAINAKGESAGSVVTASTGNKEWSEHWNGLKLWINENKPVDLVKVRSSEDVAFYLLPTEDATAINEIYYDFYEKNWIYVRDTYGDVLSDPRLHVILFPTQEAGVASIGHYRDSFSEYRNIVYIKAPHSWFKGTEKRGYIYDVMSHELCHIIEGIGSGKNRSIFYALWGDSKWAEIFQYDIFKGLGVERAESWHNEYMNGAGNVSYPTPGKITNWYKDFFYPIYSQYGKTTQLIKFFKLIGEHYKQKNGSLIGNGNVGELVHFKSGSAGVSVKDIAKKAFGWNDMYEMQLKQAQKDYPLVTYKEQAVVTPILKNICQNGGEMKSNKISNDNINNLFDNNYETSYTVQKGEGAEYLTIIYESKVPAIINKYVIGGKEYVVSGPKSWRLFGSMNAEDWNLIDTQSELADTNNQVLCEIQNNAAYQFFKFDFEFRRVRKIELSEIELWGKEYVSVPYDLKVTALDKNSSYIDWSCDPEQVENYIIERSTDGVNFSHIAEVHQHEISYKDQLAETGGYFYRVVVKNKNENIPNIYSNIGFINTASVGINENIVSLPSFFEILEKLDNHANNNLQVYTLSGASVYETRNVDSNILSILRSKLPFGLYVLKIDFGQKTGVPAINCLLLINPF